MNQERKVAYYSPVTSVDGLVFISGQGPNEPVADRLVQGSIEEQAERILQNLSTVLSDIRLACTDVVKVHFHLRNIEDFDGFNKVHAPDSPGKNPARTSIGSDTGRMLLEIDAIAYKRQVSRPAG